MRISRVEPLSGDVRDGGHSRRYGDVRCCEGFRMPAHDDGATHSEGRRPQTSKGMKSREGGGGRCGMRYRELRLPGVAMSKPGNFQRLSTSNACTTLALWHEYC